MPWFLIFWIVILVIILESLFYLVRPKKTERLFGAIIWGCLTLFAFYHVGGAFLGLARYVQLQNDIVAENYFQVIKLGLFENAVGEMGHIILAFILFIIGIFLGLFRIRRGLSYHFKKKS